MKRHEIEPVAVTVEVFNVGTKTTVLYRCMCGCGLLKTRQLDGRWTLDQIRGEGNAA